MVKIIKFLKENHISEFIFVIILLICSTIILNYTGNIFPKDINFPYYSNFLNLINILKIEIVPENSNTLLVSVYKRYIILFLGGGYLTYLILLTILFHKTCRESILYMGPLYFSLAMCGEILSYILPFDNTKIFFTALSWIFAFCGYIRFIRYFINIFFEEKKELRFLNIFVSFLTIIAVFPLAMAIKEFYFIFFDEALVSTALGINIFFNYFKKFFICIIILLSFVSFFYNSKNKNKKTESFYYFILFFIQFLFNTYVYKKLNLYGNFEFMAHVMLNILFVHVWLEDIKLTSDNQFFRSINSNALRILITFITISFFIKQITLTGYVTLLITIIIFVETVSFVILFFSGQQEVTYDNFLNKLKGIETIKELEEFMETELTKMFRLIECNFVLLPVNTTSKFYEEQPLIIFGPVYKNIKYDICFKIQNKNKTLGFIYIKDPWLLLYKKKMKNFKYLVQQIAPLVENLTLKTVQINHYKKQEEYLSEKIEKLEKDIFYTKELLSLLENAEENKKHQIIEMIKLRLAQEKRGEI